MWPQASSSRPIPEQIVGDGLLLQHQKSAVFDGWGAHVRYFLARYPLETRQFVAQRLATYGIRSLLASHSQEDLNLDVLASATDSADKDVLSMMREHARVRRTQSDRRKTSAHAPLIPPETRQVLADVAAEPAARAALHERKQTDNVADRGGVPSSRGKRHTVVGRPDVLTRYPFVDDLAGKPGGGVGAALNRATPTIPVQHLAKREIRRLAHETFSELKASALGIRLSDLPTAVQYLFFGDSASLLTTKGAGPGAGVGGRQPPARSAKDVHLVMALARESLSPTLALAARDTSTLSSASIHEGPDAEWTRDGQNMFISERRWMKLVAHVVRRLWEIDGTPRSGDAGWRGPGNAPSRPPRTAVADPAKAPHAIQLQQPAWRPVGGRQAVTSRPAARLPGFDRGDENVGEAFSRSGGSLRPDSTWGSAAADDDGAASTSLAWDKGQGDSELWTGAGRSLARAPDVSERAQLFDESGAGEARVRGSWGRGVHHDGGRRNSVAARDIRGGSAGGRGEVDGVRRRIAGRGRSGVGGDGDKEGTRPAGMWQVIPPSHVAAVRRAKQARGGSWKKEGPAYLRGVQSKIGEQVGAHRERLRKIANARKSAVMDAVARRRLESLDGAPCDIRVDSDSGVDGDGRLPNRGHTPGEHALDIADAFLGSSLMTRLAGGDWFGSEDGEAISARSLSGWGPEGLELARPRRPRPRDRQARGSDRAIMRSLKGSAKGTRASDARDDDDGSRSRPSHAGWLGDFGPPHTHTVRETVREDDEKGEDGGRSEQMEAGERRTMRGDDDGAGAVGHAAMRGLHDKSEEREGSTESSGLTPVGHNGRNGSDDGDDCVDDFDVYAVGSTRAVEASWLGPDGPDAAHSGADVVGIGSPLNPDVAYHLPNQASTGGRGGDRDGRQNADPRGEDEGKIADLAHGGDRDGRQNADLRREDEEKIADLTGDDCAVAPMFEGLEAYLRLSSESGAVLGEGQAREVAGVSGGGDRDSGERVASVEETSGESVGCWWEEDKSAL